MRIIFFSYFLGFNNYSVISLTIQKTEVKVNLRNSSKIQLEGIKRNENGEYSEILLLSKGKFQLFRFVLWAVLLPPPYFRCFYTLQPHCLVWTSLAFYDIPANCGGHHLISMSLPDLHGLSSLFQRHGKGAP